MAAILESAEWSHRRLADHARALREGLSDCPECAAAAEDSWRAATLAEIHWRSQAAADWSRGAGAPSTETRSASPDAEAPRRPGEPPRFGTPRPFVMQKHRVMDRLAVLFGPVKTVRKLLGR